MMINCRNYTKLGPLWATDLFLTRNRRYTGVSKPVKISASQPPLYSGLILSLLDFRYARLFYKLFYAT